MEVQNEIHQIMVEMAEKTAFPPCEYWIIFRASDRWYRRFLHTNFGHCFILTKDKYNWLEINQTLSRLRLTILPFANNDDVPRKYKDHLTYCQIVYVKLEKESTRKGMGMMPTCVGIVKHIMGLKLFALTPYQLYKKLLKMDCRAKARHNIEQVKLIF